MEQILENYLTTVEKRIKPLPVSERVDIINEIKSTMIEMSQNGGLQPEEIINRLGDPHDLAREYVGSLISDNPGFRAKKLLAMISFYGMVGFTGMFVLPILSVLSGGLILCGIAGGLAGILDAAGYVIGFHMPFTSFQFGSFILHPLLALPVAILMGILLVLAGKGTWKLLMKYIHIVSVQKQQLD